MYYQKFRASKYGAIPTEYAGGRFASKFEAGYAQELDLRKSNGEILSWDKQVTLDLRVNGMHICNYRIDFIVHLPDGSREFVETKGFFTPDFRIKWKIFEATFKDFKKHPDDKMLLVQQSRFYKKLRK